METTPRQPAGIWQGEPSGQRFAALLSERASQTGIRVTVDVVPMKEVDGYLVNLHWEAEPDDGLLYEVVDWVNGVRIMDPHGEDVTVEQSLVYFTARTKGTSPQDAFQIAVPDRSSWWRRHRERRRRRPCALLRRARHVATIGGSTTAAFSSPTPTSAVSASMRSSTISERRRNHPAGYMHQRRPRRTPDLTSASLRLKNTSALRRPLESAPPAAFPKTGTSYGTLHTSLEGASSETADTGIHVAERVKAPPAEGVS
jgi:hypothetical protein